MAAPEPSEQRTIECYRCFAVIPAGSPYCPECGVAIADMEGSDQAVYPELAKANLERRKGNYKGAIETCLGILRNYPNNVTAHSLLGEIYMEQGDLAQASEWLEMALDLEPRAHRERALLDDVKARMARRETEATVEQLEIKPRSGITAFAAGLILLIVAVAAAAFFIGSKTGPNRMQVADATPIVVPPDHKIDEKSVNPTEPSTTPAPAQDSSEKRYATAFLSAVRDPSIIRSVHVLWDSNSLVILAQVPSGTALEQLAFELTKDAARANLGMYEVIVQLESAEKVEMVTRTSGDLFRDYIQGRVQAPQFTSVWDPSRPGVHPTHSEPESSNESSPTPNPGGE